MTQIKPSPAVTPAEFADGDFAFQFVGGGVDAAQDAGSVGDEPDAFGRGRDAAFACSGARIDRDGGDDGVGFDIDAGDRVIAQLGTQIRCRFDNNPE